MLVGGRDGGDARPGAQGGGGGGVTEGHAATGWQLFPTLARWLTQAPVDHPWKLWIETPWPRWESIGGSLEAILTALDAAGPGRIQRKRQAFARDVVNHLDTRAELNVGYALAQAGLNFEFGGDGQPDYVPGSGTGDRVGVEVATRSRDACSQLYDEVGVALGARNVVVALRVPRQLAMSAEDRAAACRRIVEAVDGLAPGRHLVGFTLPEASGSFQVTSPSLTGLPYVVMDMAPATQAFGAEIEREILNVLSSKSAQAHRGGWGKETVLLVDVSRLGLSWLPAGAVWDRRLQTMGIPWNELPFAGLIIATSDLEHAGITASGVIAPTLQRPGAGHISAFFARLGVIHEQP